MKKIPIKEKIRYWFYFLQLAYQSEDKQIKKNLNNKKIKEFYKPWGDVRNERNYNDWWRRHSDLFMDKATKTEVLREGSFSVDDNYFCVRIPLHFSPTQVGSMIKRMYSEEQGKNNPYQVLIEKQGKYKRHTREKLQMKDYKGRYSLTTESTYHENTYQVDKMKEYYYFAKYVYLKLINKDLVRGEQQQLWRDQTLKTFGVYDYEELTRKKVWNKKDKFKGKFSSEFKDWWIKHYREFQIKSDKCFKKYKEGHNKKVYDWEDKEHWCYIKNNVYHRKGKEKIEGRLPLFVLGECFYEKDNRKIHRLRKTVGIGKSTGGYEGSKLFNVRKKEFKFDHSQSKKIENDNRTIRGLKENVQKILLNVSKGIFPGDYTQNRGKKK